MGASEVDVLTEDVDTAARQAASISSPRPRDLFQRTVRDLLLGVAPEAALV